MKMRSFILRIVKGFIFGTIAYLILYFSFLFIQDFLSPILVQFPGLYHAYPKAQFNYVYLAIFISISIASSLLSGTVLNLALNTFLSVLFFYLLINFLNFGTISLSMDEQRITFEFKSIILLWMVSLILYIMGDMLKFLEKR